MAIAKLSDVRPVCGGEATAVVAPAAVGGVARGAAAVVRSVRGGRVARGGTGGGDGGVSGGSAAATARPSKRVTASSTRAAAVAGRAGGEGGRTGGGGAVAGEEKVGDCEAAIGGRAATPTAVGGDGVLVGEGTGVFERTPVASRVREAWTDETGRASAGEGGKVRPSSSSARATRNAGRRQSTFKRRMEVKFQPQVKATQKQKCTGRERRRAGSSETGKPSRPHPVQLHWPTSPAMHTPSAPPRAPKALDMNTIG